MFCKHCGKNIYDLEKCPFCDEGKKADEEKVEKEENSVENEKTTEMEEENTKANVKNSAEKVDAKEKKKEDNYKINTSPYEPNEKDDGFASEVAKSNKAFKVFDNLGFIPIVATVASAFILFLFVWITDTADSKFFVLLFKALNLLLPCFWFFALEIVFEVVQLIIFMVQAKKKNPSTKSLFAGVYLGDGNYEYGDVGHCNIVWQAISLKHDKTSFIISIFVYIMKIAEIAIITALARPIILNVLIPAATIYDAFTKGFTEMVFSGENVNKIIVLVATWISIDVIKFILNRIRKISHKRLVKRLKIGELEK